MTSRPGPFVRIGALSGHTLVGSISVAVGSRRSERFTLALPPGRYRISSPPASPREVRVRPGRITHVGLFGACTTPPATVTTIPVAGGGSTTTSTLPASDIASAPRCTTADLAVSALKFEAGLGNVAEWIAFKNVGETLCTLTGYPGVAALDGRGVQVQQARRSVAAYLGGLGPYLEPPTVPLEPGQVATATVDGSDNPVGGTSCPYFPALLVTVPDETGSIVLEGVGWQGPTFSAQGFPGCAPLTVTPVVPGDSGRYP
jgi:hypothetical protein